MNASILEIVVVIAILVVVFTVLLKYLKWAVEAVVVFVLVLLGLYIALRVLNYGDSSGAIKNLLQEVKEALGFNDPKTKADVAELTSDVVETTNADEYISKFNLKKIWDDIKAILSF
jgi:hypothetical protein